MRQRMHWLISLVIYFIFCDIGYCSGWIKESGNHYSKISLTEANNKKFAPDTEFGFQEDERTANW